LKKRKIISVAPLPAIIFFVATLENSGYALRNEIYSGSG